MISDLTSAWFNDPLICPEQLTLLIFCTFLSNDRYAICEIYTFYWISLPLMCHRLHRHHLLFRSQVLFPLIIIFFNQWCTPPLRLRFSNCTSTFITCDVPSIVFFLRVCWVFAWCYIRLLFGSMIADITKLLRGRPNNFISHLLHPIRLLHFFLYCGSNILCTGARPLRSSWVWLPFSSVTQEIQLLPSSSLLSVRWKTFRYCWDRIMSLMNMNSFEMLSHQLTGVTEETT